MPFVTDTHSLVWYMTDDPRLSPEARRIFQQVDDFQDRIFVPCIIFFELLYLIDKKKIACDLDSFIARVWSSDNYCVEPLCLPIIEKSRRIPREKLADPWDRLIAATAMHLNLPLITRDRSLGKMGSIEVVW